MAQRFSRTRLYQDRMTAGRAGAGTRRRKPLPPHLLPGTSRRRGNAGRLVGILAGLAAAVFLIFAASVVAGALSIAAAAAATMQQYEEINGSLPNASHVAADTFQTTRILDRDWQPAAGSRRSGYGLANLCPL
jgi:hypothetical protein